MTGGSKQQEHSAECPSAEKDGLVRAADETIYSTTAVFPAGRPFGPPTGSRLVREVFTPGTSFTIHEQTYHISEYLKQGGYGVVFAISDVSTGTSFAAKVVPRTCANSIIMETMVLAELRKESFAPLKHVFVPVVLAASFAKVKGQEFAILVMERAVGSLQDHSAGGKKEPLPPKVVAGVAWAIASTLATMHDIRLVHGDIKPGNILMRDHLYSLLADYGCSVKLEDWHRVHLNNGGWSKVAVGHEALEVLGYTPAYAAPEIIAACQGSSKCIGSAKGDIFAWAKTIVSLMDGNLSPLPTHLRDAIEECLAKELQRPA